MGWGGEGVFFLYKELLFVVLFVLVKARGFWTAPTEEGGEQVGRGPASRLCRWCATVCPSYPRRERPPN